MIEAFESIPRSSIYSFSAFHLGSLHSAMDIQAPIFCCPLAEQCGNTHESLGHKLEPFMKWARERATSQVSTATEDYARDFLIEVVKTRQHAQKQPSSRVFLIRNDQDGSKGYKESLAARYRQMNSSAPVEECRILVCINCQLSYSVFLFKKQQQTDPPSSVKQIEARFGNLVGSDSPG